MVGPEVEALTDDLLLKVLGRPGFSTAERVSSVSGRGVGHRRGADAGPGASAARWRSRSTPGEGTTFTLRLPLDPRHPAGAARPGWATERYLVPLSYVAETVEFDAAADDVGARAARRWCCGTG